MTTVIRPASLVVAQDGADFLSNRKRSDKQTERRVLDPDIQFHERLEVAEFDVHLLFYFPPLNRRWLELVWQSNQLVSCVHVVVLGQAVNNILAY